MCCGRGTRGCPGAARAGEKVWGCDGEDCNFDLSKEKRIECRELHRSQGYKIAYTKKAGKDAIEDVEE